MEFGDCTIKEIADMICGNFKAEESSFLYCSSSHLTEFFQDYQAWATAQRARPTWVGAASANAELGVYWGTLLAGCASQRKARKSMRNW
jgi:hypothetical protein